MPDIPEDWKTLNVRDYFTRRGGFPSNLRITRVQVRGKSSNKIYAQWLPSREEDPRENQGRGKNPKGKRLVIQESMNTESNNAKHLYMVAAVSDFIPEKIEGKMKRSEGNMTLNLSPNVDIVKEYKEKYKMINVISFSAQTNDDLNFKKINEKNSDFLVINNINDISFGSDTNKVTIINKKDKVFESEEKNKHIIAQEIIKNTLI